MKYKHILSVTGILVLMSFTQAASALKIVTVDPGVQQASQVPFITRSNALAMNIPYEPILNLRTQLERQLSLKLSFLQSWNKNGEAHITTITPPELAVLSKKLKLEKINQIAKAEKIQDSDIAVLGLGRGEKILDNKKASTFFVIVKSEKLLRIRQTILEQFVKNGGEASAFNPKSFYPHITVGYTDRDLHETDGVIKDMEHSLDKEFELKLQAAQ